MQAIQRLMADCARCGLLQPALHAAELLRGSLWRAPVAEAAAALLRCAARAAGPPLGGGGRAAPEQLLSLWRRHGARHPAAWGALLAGLWEAGDGEGRLIRPALLAAMAAPVDLPEAPACVRPLAADAAALELEGHPGGALSGGGGCGGGGGGGGGAGPGDVADRARSEIIGDLIAAMLAADPGQVPEAHPPSLHRSGGGGGGSGVFDDYARGSPPPRPERGGRRRFWRRAPAPHGGAGRAGHLPEWDAAAATPGMSLTLPLRVEQQGAGPRRLGAALGVLEFLGAAGVRVRHDAALAAALQALRMCRHAEDARASGGCGAGLSDAWAGGGAGPFCR
jgi:hypothetical protein